MQVKLLNLTGDITTSFSLDDLSRNDQRELFVRLARQLDVWEYIVTMCDDIDNELLACKGQCPGINKNNDEQCATASPKEFLCTLPAGHHGSHVACGLSRHDLEVWN